MEPSEATWAWLAGIYEGQGSVAQHRSSRYRVRLQFKTTDEDVARFALARIGGNVFGPYQYTYRDGVARRPYWNWVSDGLDPRRVAAAMWPWLGHRRRERLRYFALEPASSPALEPALEVAVRAVE
jgi:hypothetical protein